jgi:hypothetical protein
MHALKVFRSPVWLLLHKLSLPHYRYIRKMRRGDRLPLTQEVEREGEGGRMRERAGEDERESERRENEWERGRVQGRDATSHFANITVVWQG